MKLQLSGTLSVGCGNEHSIIVTKKHERTSLAANTRQASLNRAPSLQIEATVHLQTAFYTLLG